ncbi:MAG: hypothetical protein JW991_05285 [Candidatus Pacebacteria bacterium]|nr:hypothetical protein [Candidatus Paceibacterota bacterium]
MEAQEGVVSQQPEQGEAREKSPLTTSVMLCPVQVENEASHLDLDGAGRAIAYLGEAASQLGEPGELRALATDRQFTVCADLAQEVVDRLYSRGPKALPEHARSILDLGAAAEGAQPEVIRTLHSSGVDETRVRYNTVRTDRLGGDRTVKRALKKAEWLRGQITVARTVVVGPRGFALVPTITDHTELSCRPLDKKRLTTEDATRVFDALPLESRQALVVETPWPTEPFLDQFNYAAEEERGQPPLARHLSSPEAAGKKAARVAEQIKGLQAEQEEYVRLAALGSSS